jgi:hypothetical protein
MDIEIPDNEDAARVLDVLCSTLARQGQYAGAEGCIGAALRLRADAEEIARLEAEIAELRADLEWLATSGWGVVIDRSEIVNDDYSKSIPCDGTPAGILAALRQAEETTR